MLRCQGKHDAVDLWYKSGPSVKGQDLLRVIEDRCSKMWLKQYPKPPINGDDWGMVYYWFNRQYTYYSKIT